MTSIFSQLESARFGRRIGRANPERIETAHDVLDWMNADELDIAIVRVPSSEVQLAAVLSQVPGCITIAADTLMYWECTAHGRLTDPPAGAACGWVDDTTEIEILVRATFEAYDNHYAANPLLSRASALDGYVEWATSLVEAGRASCMVTGPEAGRLSAFAIVDWAVDLPDIRLAGVLPTSRGRGAYRDLLRHVMREASQRGSRGLQISTQAHNTKVMRAWAALGWEPRSAFTTYHVVRADLLQSVAAG